MLTATIDSRKSDFTCTGNMFEVMADMQQLIVGYASGLGEDAGAVFLRALSMSLTDPELYDIILDGTEQSTTITM